MSRDFYFKHCILNTTASKKSPFDPLSSSIRFFLPPLPTGPIHSSPPSSSYHSSPSTAAIWTLPSCSDHNSHKVASSPTLINHIQTLEFNPPMPRNQHMRVLSIKLSNIQRNLRICWDLWWILLNRKFSPLLKIWWRGRYLPAVGRFLIVVTFLEDALRIVTQFGDQVYYLITYRRFLPWGIAHIFLIVNVCVCFLPPRRNFLIC